MPVLVVLDHSLKFPTYPPLDQERKFNVRSMDFTTLLKISRKDFVTLLKEFPTDYEIYCDIKDNVIQNSRLEIIDMSCYVCGSTRHYIDVCPFIHLDVNKKIALYNYRKQDRQEQHNFIRLERQKHRSILLQSKVEQQAEDFQDDNETICEEYHGTTDSPERYSLTKRKRAKSDSILFSPRRLPLPLRRFGTRMRCRGNRAREGVQLISFSLVYVPADRLGR